MNNTCKGKCAALPRLLRTFRVICDVVNLNRSMPWGGAEFARMELLYGDIYLNLGVRIRWSDCFAICCRKSERIASESQDCVPDPVFSRGVRPANVQWVAPFFPCIFIPWISQPNWILSLLKKIANGKAKLFGIPAMLGKWNSSCFIVLLTPELYFGFF